VSYKNCNLLMHKIQQIVLNVGRVTPATSLFGASQLGLTSKFSHGPETIQILYGDAKCTT
jgi:hypothetical protein